MSNPVSQLVASTLPLLQDVMRLIRCALWRDSQSVGHFKAASHTRDEKSSVLSVSRSSSCGEANLPKESTLNLQKSSDLHEIVAFDVGSSGDIRHFEFC
jgi:hypothetical protein